MIAFSTLQGIYTVVKQIYDTIQKIENAPEAIQELVRQALVTQGVIEALKADLERRRDADLDRWSREPRLEMLERARELTEVAEKFLKKATKEKEDGKTKVRKVSWVLFLESDARDLAAKFQAFNVSLSAIHSSMQVQLSRDVLDLSQHGHRETKEALHTLEARQEMSFRTISQQTAESTAVLQHTISEMQEQLDWVIYMTARKTVTSAANTQSRGVNQVFDEICTASPLTHAYPRCGGSSINNGCGTHVHCEQPACQSDCNCRYHKALESIIPTALSFLLGRLYVPRDIRSILSQPRTQCDEPRCKRHRVNLLTIKYHFPAWFRRIDAEIRVENPSSIHFFLRAPRIVGETDLDWLGSATLDEVREKLWSRELTVNDVTSDGYTVLHTVTTRLTVDSSETAQSIVSLLMEHSAPTDWEFLGLAPTGHALWMSILYWRHFGSREAAMRAHKLQFGSYPWQDIEDVWEELAIKLDWTDLHRYLCALLSPPSPVIPPVLAPHVNTRDSRGYTPLLYAVFGDTDAVQALLRAGADPRINKNIIWAVRQGADEVIGVLVRAGAYINLTSDEDGRTALHWAANPNLRYSINAFPVALELVRHAGHLLDWNVRDRGGLTALDCARERVGLNSLDEDSKRILELYSAHQLPEGAQYLPTTPLVDVEDESGEDDSSCLPSTSLIRSGLHGDVGAIGDLIQRGAMVNEHDHDGRTLLHLVALGQIPAGYPIALELVRNGGWGVHWDAAMHDDDRESTPLEIAERRLADLEGLDDEQRIELEMIRDLLKARRLPPGEEYLWSCMDSDFYLVEPESQIPGAWNGD